MTSRFFSKETGGFYSRAIHGIDIPDDAKEIDQDRYDLLMDGAASGLVISADENGYPVLASPPTPSVAENNQMELERRVSIANQQIAILAPAVEGGYAKPEHTKLLADWQRHRYDLALVPDQLGWPEMAQWPDEPKSAV